MPRIEPNWREIVEINDEGNSWQIDRLRKCRKISQEAETLEEVFQWLREKDALTVCSPAILTENPNTAEWYIALAGYAQKTLKNSGARAVSMGLSVQPDTFVKNLVAGRNHANRRDLETFSRWINHEIEEVLTTPAGNEMRYALHVAMIWGGRVIGQGQNEGGELAVEILKRALYDNVGNKARWQYRNNNGRFVPCQSNIEEAEKSPVWNYQGTRNTEFDFTAGGNRPDIKISQNRAVLLVAEIKGRKDLSNTWESWMPQVADHMRTWQREFPRAAKGVCMTTVTQEMVRGASIRGTSRTGLKQLFEDQLLDFVINLTGLLIRNRSQVEEVRRIFGALAV